MDSFVASTLMHLLLHVTFAYIQEIQLEMFLSISGIYKRHGNVGDKLPIEVCNGSVPVIMRHGYGLGIVLTPDFSA
uniref:Uncharacterized protein n=1 Tax=Arundo donax TaxID=35708 RepID=A0A0A9DKJ5_ARUDO